MSSLSRRASESALYHSLSSSCCPGQWQMSRKLWASLVGAKWAKMMESHAENYRYTQYGL